MREVSLTGDDSIFQYLPPPSVDGVGLTRKPNLTSLVVLV